MARFDKTHEVKYAEIDVSGSGTTIVMSPDSGVRLVVLSYVIVASGATIVKWQSKPAGSAVELSGLGIALPNNGAAASAYSPSGLFSTSEDEILQINNSAIVNLGGHFSYVEITS